MTISTTYTPDNYAGTGSTTLFTINFDFLDVSTNVKVSLKVESTGVITQQTTPTQYSISGSNVTMVTAPASGETLILELSPDFKQQSDYRENDEFPAETLETDLDERTIEGQINNNLVNNSVQFDPSTVTNMTSTTVVASTTASSNADKYIKFDSSGTGLEISTLSSTAGLGTIVEDTTPQLGGDLDANSFDIQFDDATGIRDDSDNEQLIFQKTASAVNHIQITNAATGGEPILEATGDDTDVSLELRAQGSGTVSILGNSTQSGVLRIYEDTDQGTAYVGLTAPSNTSTPSVTYTLPDGDGSSGEVLQTNGSGVMSWTTPTSRINPTMLINGDFRVSQRGTSFDSTTTPANDDDTYLLDRWILLSDGNNAVDVAQEASTVPTGAKNAIKMEVETANKKFGILQILEATDSERAIGDTVSVSFKARNAAADDATDSIKVAVLSWDSTADSVTSDVVSAWNADETTPTFAANWTAENTPAVLSLTQSYQTFSVTGISVDTASTNNIAVFIWCDNADGAVDDIVYIADVKLEIGSSATAYEPISYASEFEKCLRYAYRINGVTLVASGYFFSTTQVNGYMEHPVTMRTSPSITTSTAGAFDVERAGTSLSNTTGSSFNSISTKGCQLTLTGSAASTIGYGSNIYLESGDWLNADAEL